MRIRDDFAVPHKGTGQPHEHSPGSAASRAGLPGASVPPTRVAIVTTRSGPEALANHVSPAVAAHHLRPHDVALHTPLLAESLRGFGWEVSVPLLGTEDGERRLARAEVVLVHITPTERGLVNMDEVRKAGCAALDLGKRLSIVQLNYNEPYALQRQRCEEQIRKLKRDLTTTDGRQRVDSFNYYDAPGSIDCVAKRIQLACDRPRIDLARFFWHRRDDELIVEGNYDFLDAEGVTYRSLRAFTSFEASVLQLGLSVRPGHFGRMHFIASIARDDEDAALRLRDELYRVASPVEYRPTTGPTKIRGRFLQMRSQCVVSTRNALMKAVKEIHVDLSDLPIVDARVEPHGAEGFDSGERFERVSLVVDVTSLTDDQIQRIRSKLDRLSHKHDRSRPFTQLSTSVKNGEFDLLTSTVYFNQAPARR